MATVWHAENTPNYSFSKALKSIVKAQLMECDTIYAQSLAYYC